MRVYEPYVQLGLSYAPVSSQGVSGTDDSRVDEVTYRLGKLQRGASIIEARFFTGKYGNCPSLFGYVRRFRDSSLESLGWSNELTFQGENTKITAVFFD